MKIEFLYFEGCPHVAPTLSLLEEVVANLAPDATIDKVLVQSPEEAEKLGFFGSPSIHVDGIDLEGSEGRQCAMACRVYEGGGVPPKWLIEAALLRARASKWFLFLCVANSARSQMGEGVARLLAPEGVRVQSAGSHPTRVRAEASAVLAELGIDTASHASKNVADIDPATVDTVITLCAEEECPVFLGNAHRLHWGLPDPAAVEGDDDTRLQAFRAAREELQKRLGYVFPQPKP